ncbi:MAG: undecaprenyl-diphosphate phosphatase [Candidatus Daviesbacteria bacterium]|nr:undecaprenyl-diphosphate phosphatase [Candidatus Daviesbacteria bacterium]
MDFLQAIILSIVEGVTEFLPISSTGHLVLASELLKISQTDFVKNFEIIIQLGAILAVVVLYFKSLLNFKLWPKIIVAFLPTGILGLTLYKIIKDILLGNTMVTLAALFLGGVALIVLEKLYTEQPHHLDKVEDMSYMQAFGIGLVQSVSMIPGVSRSAATIIGGMFLGLKRTTATEFSFLLAVPTMVAATGFDLIKADFKFSSSEVLLLSVGFLGSFITALIVVKFLIGYVKKNTFIPFGIYRIILALVFWLVLVKS